MRVLIASPTFPPFNSGLGNAAMRQAEALARAGVSVVVATSGVERSTRINEQGLRVEEFAVQGAEFLANPIRGDLDSYLDFLRREAFDLILTNAWQTWSTDLCLRHQASLPGKLAVYSHGLSTNVFHWNFPLRSLIRYLLWQPYVWRLKPRLKRLDGLIVLAEDGCDTRFADVRLARKLGLKPVVIPNAVPDYAIGLPVLPWALRDDLIAVGAYEWQKGHDFVLRAYARSKARNRLRLKFYGQKFTPFSDRLRALANELGVSEWVEFHQGISGSPLFEVYRRALLFLNGSHTECQPLVLLDAMAAGTPFISRASGCIDTMSGGRAVMTEAQAAEVLDQLLTEPVWQGLSQNGLTAAATIYNPERCGQLLVTELGRLVGNPAVSLP